MSSSTKLDELTKNLGTNLTALKSSELRGHTRCIEEGLQKVSAIFTQFIEAKSNFMTEKDVKPHSLECDPEYLGLFHLKNELDKARNRYPYLIPRLEIYVQDQIDHRNPTRKRAAFIRDNFPLFGWQQHIIVTLSAGKRPGIYYTYGKKTFKTRMDLAHTLQEMNQLHLLDKFNFDDVYCVCQKPEDPTRPFMECAYGHCGCNAWVHPECVGLGTRSEEELKVMTSIVCPYCSFFLEGSSKLSSLCSNKLALMEVSPGFLSNDLTIHEFPIEESNMPHHLWGLEGSRCSYKTEGRDLHPLIQDAELVASFLHDNDRFDSLTSIPISYKRKSYSQIAFVAKRPKKRPSIFCGKVPSISSTEINKVDPVGNSEHTLLSRIFNMGSQTKSFTRTPSLNMSKTCLERANMCGKYLSRPRRKSSGQRTTALESGESASFSTMLPATDASTKVLALSGNQFAKSFHPMFAFGNYCGVCTLPLGKDGDVNFPCGGRHYNIHTHCNDLLEKKIYLNPTVIAQNDGPLQIGSFLTETIYQYEQIDESCNLCGHSGGVLLWFQIDKSVTTFTAPKQEGWLGHSPCLEFLLSSNFLRFVSKRGCAMGSQVDTNFQKSSVFDSVLNQYRCRLCGLNEGIVVRCCGLGCSGRVHPLCASISEGWDIIQLDIGNFYSLGVVCSLHS